MLPQEVLSCLASCNDEYLFAFWKFERVCCASADADDADADDDDVVGLAS